MTDFTSWICEKVFKLVEKKITWRVESKEENPAVLEEGLVWS